MTDTFEPLWKLPTTVESNDVWFEGNRTEDLFENYTFAELYLCDWINIDVKEEDMSSNKSSLQRVNDWEAFAEEVTEHLESYSVPQYGDKGEDMATEYTAEQCIKQAQKYLGRFGKNIREGQEELDLLKSAHWIQMAHEKLVTGK